MTEKIYEEMLDLSENPEDLQEIKFYISHLCKSLTEDMEQKQGLIFCKRGYEINYKGDTYQIILEVKKEN